MVIFSRGSDWAIGTSKRRIPRVHHAIRDNAATNIIHPRSQPYIVKCTRQYDRTKVMLGFTATRFSGRRSALTCASFRTSTLICDDRNSLATLSARTRRRVFDVQQSGYMAGSDFPWCTRATTQCNKSRQPILLNNYVSFKSASKHFASVSSNNASIQCVTVVLTLYNSSRYISLALAPTSANRCRKTNTWPMMDWGQRQELQIGRTVGRVLGRYD